MSDHVLEVVLDIKRPPHEVRAWWTEFPDDYRATDPREQPHRIVTVSKTPRERVMRTYWRGPLGREIVIPETFRFREHEDWDVDIALPFGLAQKDEFTLEPTKDGTRVTIRVSIWARNAAGKLARPAFVRLYAKPNYTRTWHAAAQLCERDAPRIPIA